VNRTLDTLDVFTLVTALGCGLVAGVFYAFSSFVMKGLGDLPAPQGIAAMQAINVAAPQPAFMIGLMGTALASLVLGGWSLLHLSEPGAGYRLAGSLLYLVGAIVITVAYHIPRNDKLATFDPQSAEAARYWSTYLTNWTAWNHARMAGSLAGAASLILSLRIG
jgi:uncharacterized membrane protein